VWLDNKNTLISSRGHAQTRKSPKRVTIEDDNSNSISMEWGWRPCCLGSSGVSYGVTLSIPADVVFPSALSSRRLHHHLHASHSDSRPDTLNPL
jgi:hypothetical protein